MSEAPPTSQPTGAVREGTATQREADQALEIRRLTLRLEALRGQLLERLDLIQQLRAENDQLRGADASTPAGENWRQRALAAEDRYEALLNTRSMRLLQRPREVYGRLRQRYPALRR